MARFLLLFAVLLALPPGCAWTEINHSGVAECHLAGPPPAPPATFMAVDSTLHLEL